MIRFPGLRWGDFKEDMMFLTDRKLERRISELEPYRYRDIIGLKSFAAAEDDQGVVNPALPAFEDRKSVV